MRLVLTKTLVSHLHLLRGKILSVGAFQFVQVGDPPHGGIYHSVVAPVTLSFSVLSLLFFFFLFLCHLLLQGDLLDFLSNVSFFIVIILRKIRCNMYD